MECESDSVRCKLVAAGKTGCQVFAYVVPNLWAFLDVVVVVSRWRPRAKREVSQSGNERFVYPTYVEVHLPST
jgi:hypothetical protein